MSRLINIALTLLIAIACVSGFAALQATSAAVNRNGARANQPTITNRTMVDKGSVIATVAAVGNIAANQQSNLTFDGSGVITSIKVKLGDHVTAGQTLATIDDSSQQATIKQADLALQAAQSALNKLLQPVDANTLAQAQAQVQAAEGSYTSKASSGSNASTIAADQAKLQQTQADAAYAETLRQQAGGRVPTTDPSYQMALAQLGQATFNVAQAQINLQNAQNSGSSLLSAQANIASAQAKLTQTKAGPTQSTIDQAQVAVLSAQTQLDQAKSQLSQTVLVAPYAGVIEQINGQVGGPSQINATTTGAAPIPVMIIADVSKLYANVNVDESDITTIHAGQKVTLTVDALPGVQLNGSVDRIYPIADSTASVITYPVHVVLDTTDAKTAQTLRAGMTANATFSVKQIDNVTRVPNNYLKTNPVSGLTTVSLVAPDGINVTTVPVKLGVAGADYTEVIQGLNPGDTVALVSTTTSSQGGQSQQAPAGQ